MASQLTVKFATKKVAVSLTTVPGLFSSSLKAIFSDAAPVVATSEKPEVVFDSVEDGAYEITHSRLDSTGALIGEEITDVITVKGSSVVVEKLVDAVAAASYAAEALPEFA